jgi:tripartite-type tricarboxylate transporter receptor subunit TctC
LPAGQFLYLAATAALPASFAPTASGQTNFPNRFIKIVNPLPSGSGPDVVIRLTGEKLMGFFGQQIVVENRPGGGGAIAAQAVASASPDGYTILLAVASIFAVLPAQKGKIQVDVNQAFTAVGMVGDGPLYLAVPAKLGVTSFPEFIALAKSKPGEIFVGTNSAGSLPHFAGLALDKKGNIPITVVPYNQGGTLGAITDILGGRIHAVIEAMFGLRGHVQSGDLKAIGVMSPERDPDFPDVPTVAASIPGFTAIGWLSLATPTGTPETAVSRLSEGLRHALEDSTIKLRLAELGLRPMVRTPTETKAFIESEQNFWWPIVREYESR